jgi:hypothetical protein
VRRLVHILFFLMLVNEGDPTTLYAKSFGEGGFQPTGFALFNWVEDWLFEPLPIKVRPFDVAMLVILAIASSRKAAKGPRVGPLRNALFLQLATVVLWYVYGIATGGDARAASWQTYLLLSSALFAFTVSTVFVTAEHYEMLARTVIAAGLYRAAMCWYFYFFVVQTQHWERRPEYVTAHDDSVIWVVSILAILAYALNRRRLKTTVLAVLLEGFLLGAIQWNTRRLAWVSLVMGLVTAYCLLPPGKARKGVKRAVLAVAPVAAIYVAVGWGRPEKIFAPLESLASVSTQEDRSTKARNAENLGLIATAKQAGALAGTGWGHGYIELTNKYSIAGAMELWPYVPHNSVLGLLAYTGILGFTGIWLAFPTAAFLNARLAKVGGTPQVRNVGFVASTAMIVCGNQMYGDMGIFSLRTMYILATTYAVALRMPMVAGTWTRAAKPRTQNPPAA